MGSAVVRVLLVCLPLAFGACRLTDILGGDGSDRVGTADAVALSADGRYVATVERDTVLRLRRVSDAAVVWTVTRDSGLAALRFSPDGSYVAVWTGARVRVLSTADGSERAAVQILSDSFDNMTETGDAIFSPDGRYIAVAAAQWRTEIRRTDGGSLVLALDSYGPGIVEGRLSGMTWLGLAFSPDGAAIADASGVVRIWGLPDGALAPTLPGGMGCLVFAPDGRRLVAGGGDSTLRVWDVATGALLRAMRDEDGGTVQPVAISPDGRFLLTNTAENAPYGGTQHLRLWNLDTGAIAQTLLTYQDYPASRATISPDGRQIVRLSGFSRHKRPVTVEAWDVETGAKLWETTLASADLACPGVTFRVLEGPVFTPDGQFVLAATNAGVWRVRRSDGHAATLLDMTRH